MAQDSHHDKSQSNATLIITVLIVALLSFGGGFVVGSRNVSDLSGQGATAMDAAGGRAPSFGEGSGPARVGAPTTMTDSPILTVGNSPILGNPDAPITVVEFSDYQCPYCQRGANTLKELVRKYPNDVRIVFKDYPLPFHKEAPAAHRAAFAAGQQGKYWEMHDELFARFKEFGGANMDELMASMASKLGLDMTKFNADYNSDAAKKVVEDGLAQGGKVGVQGTPHFFVNGERVSGAQPIDAFETIVKRQLDEAKKMVDSGTPKTELYKLMVQKNYKAAEAPKPAAEPAKTVQLIPINPNDAIRGNKDGAVITIVEFSEFQCPFCTRGNETLKQVEEKYGDKVRIVFKHLPLPFHKEAEPAARAALAAGKQGKFWQMHDALFARQKELNGNVGLLDELAKELGLNMDKFKKDMESDELVQQVKDDLALSNKVGARGTPNFFINGVQLVGAQPLPAFQSLIDEQLKVAEKLQKEKNLKGDALYAAIVEENKKNAPAPAPAQAPESDTVDVKLLAVAGSPTKGPKNAPVTIYEFSDFQCPFCERVNPTLKAVEEKYGDKVQIVFKSNPLPFHKEAPAAHRASLAAHKQGKFWPMHDKLFASFKSWGGANMDEVLTGYAQELGLNVEQFKKDYNSPEIAKQVEDEMAMGAKAGVRGTPSFVINGKKLVGAQPLPAFEAAIDEALAAKK